MVFSSLSQLSPAKIHTMPIPRDSPSPGAGGGGLSGPAAVILGLVLGFACVGFALCFLCGQQKPKHGSSKDEYTSSKSLYLRGPPGPPGEPGLRGEQGCQGPPVSHTLPRAPVLRSHTHTHRARVNRKSVARALPSRGRRDPPDRQGVQDPLAVRFPLCDTLLRSRKDLYIIRAEFRRGS